MYLILLTQTIYFFNKVIFYSLKRFAEGKRNVAQYINKLLSNLLPSVSKYSLILTYFKIMGEKANISIFKKPMLPLTPEEQEAYDNATTCHICGVMGFIEKDKKRDKAQDHSQLTGKYRYLFILFYFLFLLIMDYYFFFFCFRGPVHIECNLNYQD